jgi:uncharacterized protein
MKFIWKAIRWLLSIAALATSGLLLFVAWLSYYDLEEQRQWVPSEWYLLAGIIVAGALFALLFFLGANPLLSKALGWKTGKSQWTAVFVAMVGGATALAGILFQYDRLMDKSRELERMARKAAEEALVKLDIEATVSSMIEVALRDVPEGVFAGSETFDREVFLVSIFRNEAEKADASSALARQLGIGGGARLCNVAVRGTVDAMTMETARGNEFPISLLKETIEKSDDPRQRFFAAEMHRLCGTMIAQPDRSRGLAIMKALADSGDMTALALIGLRYRDGNGAEKDEEAALSAIRRSAEAGNPLGLALLGDAFELGLAGLTRDVAAALSQYEAAAEAGQIDAIDRLTKIYAGEISGFRANPSKLNGAMNALCEAGGCGGLAAALERGEDTGSRRYTAAIRYLCDNDSPSDCVALSYNLENGIGGPADPVGALRAAERGCRADVASACKNAVIYASIARGARQENQVLVRELAEKGCALDDGVTCRYLGQYLREGKGGPKNLARAREIFLKSCDSDDFTGCAELGRMRWLGEGGPKDIERGISASRKACDANNAFGCDLLGMMMQRSDPAASASAKAKACRLGRSSAC